MSLGLRVLIGLVAGLLAGIAVSVSQNPSLFNLVSVIEPAGSLWVNALQMTVIPLVLSLLITAVTSTADVGVIGRIGAKAMLLFLTLLFAGATFAALVTPPLLAGLTIAPLTVASLRANAEGGVIESAKQVPNLAQWVINLIPVNPIKAAADGAMLPLSVFALVFGFAITRISDELGQTLTRFFEGIAEAMLVIVRWVLLLAPVGVFALVLPVATRMGVGAVGALAYYVVLASALYIIVTLLLYAVAVLFGRAPLRQFVRASAPAQAIAFSTSSSLASLPAMVEGMEKRLGLPHQITGFVLPLAVSVFRMGGPIRMTVGALFIARLYGIELNAAQVATVAVTAVFMSLGSVGLPSGAGFFVIVPVFSAVGLPVEGVGILLAVDTIPDTFNTVNNVTADMAAATIIARHSTSTSPSPIGGDSGAAPPCEVPIEVGQTGLK